MEHVFSEWDKVVKQLRNSGKIVLLCDFDGTLTPIVARPELAILPENTKRVLKTLVKNRHISLGVISGRALVDLKNMVGVDGIIYAGNHGLEIEGPGLNFIYPLTDEVKSFFRVIYRVLNITLSKIQGVIVENKGPTLSVHYRQVKESQVEKVKSTFEQITGSASAIGKVKITTGKKVLEVRPVVDWNKGKAIKLIIGEYGKGKRFSFVPVYIGDDQTDEDAFAEVNRYSNGVSILVGDDQTTTGAHYFLNSTLEVTQFLEKLLHLRERKSR